MLVGTRKKSFPINWKALWYAAEKIRTPDTLVRSQVLYPAELRPHLCCVSQQMIFYRSLDQMSSDFLTKLKPISKSSKSPNITNSKCLRKTGKPTISKADAGIQTIFHHTVLLRTDRNPIIIHSKHKVPVRRSNDNLLHRIDFKGIERHTDSIACKLQI